MVALVITVAQVLAATDGSGNFISGTAGADITAAQPLYLDLVTNTYKVAANTSVTLAAAVGLSAHGALTGQPIRIQGGRGGDMTLGAGAAPVVGMIYCVGALGEIIPSTDLASTKVVTILGVGKTGNKLTFDVFASGMTRP